MWVAPNIGQPPYTYGGPLDVSIYSKYKPYLSRLELVQTVESVEVPYLRSVGVAKLSPVTYRQHCLIAVGSSASSVGAMVANAFNDP